MSIKRLHQTAGFPRETAAGEPQPLAIREVAGRRPFPRASTDVQDAHEFGVVIDREEDPMNVGTAAVVQDTNRLIWAKLSGAMRHRLGNRSSERIARSRPLNHVAPWLGALSTSQK